MLRTTAFAVLCIVLAAYGAFKLDDAYVTFASEMPDPAGSRQVIRQTLDPIGDADAYALSQTAPSAGGKPPASLANHRTVPIPAAAKPDEGELLQLLSETGSGKDSFAIDVEEAASATPASLARKR